MRRSARPAGAARNGGRAGTASRTPRMGGAGRPRRHRGRIRAARAAGRCSCQGTDDRRNPRHPARPLPRRCVVRPPAHRAGSPPAARSPGSHEMDTPSDGMRGVLSSPPDSRGMLLFWRGRGRGRGRGGRERGTDEARQACPGRNGGPSPGGSFPAWALDGQAAGMTQVGQAGAAIRPRKAAHLPAGKEPRQVSRAWACLAARPGAGAGGAPYSGRQGHCTAGAVRRFLSVTRGRKRARPGPGRARPSVVGTGQVRRSPARPAPRPRSAPR